MILTGTGPPESQSADLNGDGQPDLIYTDYGATATASTTHVLLNNGDGTFTPGQTIATAGASIASPTSTTTATPTWSGFRSRLG